jgi:hypothetical protein
MCLVLQESSIGWASPNGQLYQSSLQLDIFGANPHQREIKREKNLIYLCTGFTHFYHREWFHTFLSKLQDSSRE